ncbi:hypothetical protein [Streptosporangium saharense]|uniref:hypothetical protein n=1 Tax=Streptosporangium saharense TaxID=1706840 RepID=UPI00369AAA9F
MTSEVGDLSPRHEARRGWWIAGTVIRVVLLLILLFGGLLVVTAMAPTPRTLPDFQSALKAGRVSVVVYRMSQPDVFGPVEPPPMDEPPPVTDTPPENLVVPRGKPGEVRGLTWAEGPLVWHRIIPGPIRDGKDVYTFARLSADTAPSGVRVTEEITANQTLWYAAWPFEIPSLLGMWWIGAAWVLTLLIMLGSTPWLANRWAWFWLFGVGQLGAIAFLILEPRPLWYRYDRRPRQRGRIWGGLGCLMSVATSLVAGGIALALGALLSRVLP